MKRLNTGSSSSTRLKIVVTAALMAGICAPSLLAQTPQIVSGATQRENVGGARWVWSLDRASPRVAFSVLVRAGASDETYETAGWRRVLAQAMLRNTIVPNPKTVMSPESVIIHQTAAERERILESLGARLGATVNDDAIEFWATGDSAHAQRVLDVLFNVVRYPRLADEDIVAARTTVRSQRQSTFNDVASLATEALDTRLYRDFANRPLAYGLPEVGSARALEAISTAQLRDLHARFFRPANLTVGATGDLNVSSLRARLTTWNKISSPVAAPTPKPAAPTPGAPTPSAPTFSSVVASEPMVLSRELGGSGDWVFVSYRVSDAAQNDLPALQVLAAALGASPLGRVPQRLLPGPNTSGANASSTRSATNVAQQASVVLVPRRWGGELVLFAQTPNRFPATRNAITVEKLREALTQEVAQMRSRALSESEISNARRYGMGAWALDRESLRSRAFRLALDEEWRSAAQTRPVWMSSGRANANLEYSNAQSWAQSVQNVTAAEVQNVARRYLTTGATVFVRSGSAPRGAFGSGAFGSGVPDEAAPGETAPGETAPGETAPESGEN